MTDLLIGLDEREQRQDQRVDEVDGYLECVEITAVTHDVKTFTFALPRSATLGFLPGQYLTFGFQIYGESVERCYTISSPPTRPERVSFTVKRVPGGVVSTWLHDHFGVGDVVAASGPFGQFSTATYPASSYLFLTAGSGITPAMSMLRTLCDRHDPANVVFVHCARTPDDIIFRDELEHLAATLGISVAFVCEDDSWREQWQGPRGRLSLETLVHVAPDLRDRDVFSCGPPPFMNAVRHLLGDLGIEEARIHEESFVLGAGAPVDVPAEPAIGLTYQVDFRQRGQVIACEATSTILDAAARAGIALPSSCAEGMCGTCKLTMLSGDVDMDHAGGIRPREIAQGKILPCCSTPTADVTLDA